MIEYNDDNVIGDIKYTMLDPEFRSFWPNQNPYKIDPHKGPVKRDVEDFNKLIDEAKKGLEKIKVVETNKDIAIKADDGKTNWSLMPFEAIEEINKVLEFGAKKYSDWNWTQGGGFKYTRLLNSLLRHIFAYMRGEDNDPESGLSHLAHAGCNIVFLLYFNKYKDQFTGDDRKFKK